MQGNEYDVVVVGAGPAGASAAEAAGKQGVKVLLIDRRLNPGSPVQCAEYVPNIVKKYVQLVPGAVVQKIDTLKTFINNELISVISGPGYMLDRSVFDVSLINNAVRAGAVFGPAARAIAKTDHGLIVNRGKTDIDIKCKIIIGADGPKSTVGNWMNSENKKFMVALQYRIALSKYQTSTDIYFSPEYHGGYAWVFPKADYANVGVGVYSKYKDKLQPLAKDFISRMVARGGLANAHSIGSTGGLIPVGGPLAVTWKDNMLLAGDAAGQTHPVTGGGIMNAMVAGKIAGETASKAITNDNLSLLAEYEQQWKAFLGRFLERAVRQREDMDLTWSFDSQKFEDMIRRTWISFN